MRAVVAILVTLASLGAATAYAQAAPPVQTLATMDFGSARIENGIIYLPGVKIAVKAPSGTTVSQVGGNGFRFRHGGDYDNYVTFLEGAGTCKDWEAMWRDKKHGDLALPSTWKKQYPKRPASYDPRWHEVLVTDGFTVVKACVTDPSGRWVELGISGATEFSQYTSQDLPAMTADVGLRMFGSAPPPPPPRPTMWSFAAQSYYKAKNECDMYSRSSNSSVQFLGQMQCDLARTQEGWIQGCQNDNVISCITAARTWSKNKEYYSAGAFFERACENGDQPSCKDALKNYDRACKEHNEKACSAAETLRTKTRK